MIRSKFLRWGRLQPRHSPDVAIGSGYHASGCEQHPKRPESAAAENISFNTKRLQRNGGDGVLRTIGLTT